MKRTGIILLLFKVTFCLAQPKQLSPGDIAITGLNFQNPDQFSFITFTHLTVGTEIKFTDCGWKSNNTFREGEGIITYTTPPEGIPAFKVLTYGIDPGFTSEGVNGFFGFSIDGDQILAFQGEFSNPVFIYALNNNENTWQADAFNNNSSSLPPGLLEGYSAVALSESKNQIYNCSIESASKEVLLHSLSNPINWIGSLSRFELPGSCFEDPLPVLLNSFTVTGVNFPSICFSFTSDQACFLTLEFSSDGIIFTTIYSESYFSGENLKSCIEDKDHSNGYYRLSLMDSDGNTYSEIQYFNRDNDLPLLIQHINLQGVMLGSFSTVEESEKHLQKFSPGEIVIVKYSYSNRTELKKRGN